MLNLLSRGGHLGFQIDTKKLCKGTIMHSSDSSKLLVSDKNKYFLKWCPL